MTTQEFYDDLAAQYHLIFADWDASITRQARVLVPLLHEMGVAPPAAVLDAAAGIGTQALGLATAGYAVTCSDLSPTSLERAQREAKARSLTIDGWLVADFRAIDEYVHRHDFAAVLVCDNALPHMLTNDDLEKALTSLGRCMVDGGLLVASVRDYDALLERKPTGTEPQLLTDTQTGFRRVVGQAWQWHDDIIDVALFVLRENGAEWTSDVYTMQYRALRRSKLDAALLRTGYRQPRWIEPGDSGFHQPIVVAQR